MIITPPIIIIGVLLLYLFSVINVLREYERGVIFRLGRLLPEPKGPGIILVFWPIDRMERVSLRTVTMDVPAQDVITRDNVTVKVNAIVYFRVLEANKAIVSVENYLYATSQIAQTTMRSVCGQAHLDELLAEREKFNARLQEIIDANTEPWGVKVVAVEVKHIDLPEEMQRSIARQAEAERLRRAKVISADGEYQAARRLAEASSIMEVQPIALQLRTLQALTQVGKERNRTVIVPVPTDLVGGLIERVSGGAD